MKKTITSVLAALLISGAAVHAYDLSITSDMTYVSKYVFRGERLGDNSLTPSVELASGDVYAGLWAAVPMEKRDSRGWENELDFYAGYDFRVNENVGLDLGATVYFLPENRTFRRSGKRQTYEMFTGVNIGELGDTGINYGVYGFYDFSLKATTFEPYIGYSFSLADYGVRAAVDFSAHAGRTFTRSNSPVDDHRYFGVSAEVPYSINENSTLNAGVHYTTSRGLTGLDRDNVFGSVSLTVGF